MREKHCCGLRGRERPLQEMDLGPFIFAREGQNELRVFACVGGDALEGVGLHDGAQAVGMSYMAKAPEGFDLFSGQRGGFLNVDEAVERLDAVLAFGDLRCVGLRLRLGRWWWLEGNAGCGFVRRGRRLCSQRCIGTGHNGFLAKLLDLVLEHIFQFLDVLQPMLSRFLVKLLPVFFQHFVAKSLVGGEEADIVNLRPAPLVAAEGSSGRRWTAAEQDRGADDVVDAGHDGMGEDGRGMDNLAK
nr:hypothetical protein CFP56_75123 [Quercus suber]